MYFEIPKIDALPFCLPWTPAGSTVGMQQGQTEDKKPDKPDEIMLYYADLREKIEKDAEVAAFKKTKGYTDRVETLETSISSLEDEKKRIKVKKDGASVYDSGKKGFLRVAANAGTMLLNLCRGMIGLDENNKWTKPENALKTAVGIGVTVGLCSIPVIGPVIGAGLLAVGIAGGIAGTAIGAKNLKEAKRKKDQAMIDKAQQEICGGVFVGVLSALGLKSAGAAARNAALTNGTTNVSLATVRNGFFGKIGQWTSQGIKDTFVNSWRTGISADRALIARNGGFMKAWGSKIAKPFTGYETRYKDQANGFKQALKSQEAEIKKALRDNSIDDSQKALLREQLAIVRKNKAQLSNFRVAKKKTRIDQIASEKSGGMHQIEGYNTSANEIEIQGQMFSKQSKEYIEFYRKLLKAQKQYEKALMSLSKTRTNMMRTFSGKPSKHLSQLTAYVGRPTAAKKWYKPSTWAQNPYTKAIGGKNPSYTFKFLGLTLTSAQTRIPMINNGIINPVYAAPILLTQKMDKETTETTTNQIKETEDKLKKTLKDLKKARTQEELAAAMVDYEMLMNPPQQGQEAPDDNVQSA